MHLKKAHAGHYWSQGGHPRTRYDLDNIRVQCAGCNTFKHGNLAIYGHKLREELGFQKFDELRLKANEAKKWTLGEIEDMIEEFKGVKGF